jgi:hypothetical protein
MLLLFVILEVGFVGTALVFAEPVLHELAWPAVLVGNPSWRRPGWWSISGSAIRVL